MSHDRTRSFSSSKNLKRYLFTVSALTLAAMQTPALAQDQASTSDQSKVQEVVITGSRIVRKDYEANSPLVTVQKNLLEYSSTAALEDTLNKLPQFSPTQKTPEGGGDIQPTARNTPGSATVSLRGIGSNRSLVLIDGRRATPSNASMVVDINSIPQAAIDHVEIITGGASSTYGADAMAGVVNFVLKKDFQGFQLDTRTGITQHGDNFEYQVSGILGTDFADGKGNISVAFSTNERKKALQADRSWYRDLWADPNVGGVAFFPPQTGFSTGFANLPTAASLNNNISGATFTGTNAPVNTGIYVDGSGNVFSGFGPFGFSGIPGVSGAKFIDGKNFKLQSNGMIGVNDTFNYLIFPLKRYNMYSRANYDITNWLGVFAQGYFSKTSSVTIQEPSPITTGWGVLIDPSINRGEIPVGLLNILDSRPDPNGLFDLRALLPFNRGSQTDVYTYNMTAGLQGTIPGSDWTYEIFGSQGQSETSVLQTGFASLQRFQAVITSGPNFGQGFNSLAAGYSNLGAPNFGFGASTATCTSGLNPFNWASVTQDCWDAIKADIKTKAVMKQTIWETNLQGKVIDLPAGELRAAVGASYRKNAYRFENDTLTTQGTSFIEQALGLYPAGNSAGEIKAKEVYGELLVPVLADLPAVKHLNLELGFRHSDYNTTGTSDTYKALADWQANDWVRFRGGYNRAERAPNIAELYLAPEQTFAVASGGDVCSTQNGQAWSANSAVNPNWQKAVALCAQLMQASGNPNADTQYYGVSAQQVINGVAPTNPQAVGPAFVFPTLTGNPNVTPEQADTLTFGVVLSSPFQSEALSALQMSIDYYYIKVKHAIGAQSVDIAQRQCFDPAFNPTYDINSPYCAGIARNATGTLGNVKTTFFNNGRFKTSGIDVQLNWGMDAGPGHVTANVVFNYLIDMKTAELAVLPLTDYAGTLGPTQNGLDGGNFRYKVLTTLGYAMNNGLYVGLQWRHLPSAKSATAAIVPTTTIKGAPSYNLFNFQSSYQLFDNVGIRFGIDNVFNKRPPVINVDTAPVAPNLAGGSFDNGLTYFYDTNGRRFYLGSTISF